MLNSIRNRFEFAAAAMFLAAWCFIFCLRAVPIGGIWGPLDPVTNWFLFVWLSVFSLSILAGGWIARKRCGDLPLSYVDMNKSVIFLSVVSVIGACFIIFEFAVVRNYGFNLPVTQVRILEVSRGMAGASASLLSGSGRLMMPAILPAFLIVGFEWRRLSKFAWLTFGLAMIAFLYEQGKFEGGRWFLFATYFALAFLLFGDLFRKNEQGEILIKNKLITMIVILGIYGSILFSYSASVFERRYTDSGEGENNAYERFAMEIIGNEFGLEAIKNSKYSSTIKFFWLYATHGVNELNIVMSKRDFCYGGGAFQFPQIARISDKLFGTDFRIEYKSCFPNVGLYNTMIGASFLDFGMFGGAIFGIAIGVGLGFSANLFGRQVGLTFSALAFPAMMTVAAMSPIVSIVNHMWPVLCWSVVAFGIAKPPVALRRWFSWA